MDNRESFELHSIELLDLIWDICGWKLDKTYRLSGTLYPKERIAEFDLKEACVISESEMNDLN
jgi:hypothetical protein